MGAHISKTTIDAAKIVKRSMERLNNTLAKKGKTFEQLLDEIRANTEKTRQKRLRQEETAGNISEEV